MIRYSFAIVAGVETEGEEEGRGVERVPEEVGRVPEEAEGVREGVREGVEERERERCRSATCWSVMWCSRTWLLALFGVYSFSEYTIFIFSAGCSATCKSCTCWSRMWFCRLAVLSLG
jgi:hypothetical protein